MPNSTSLRMRSERFSKSGSPRALGWLPLEGAPRAGHALGKTPVASAALHFPTQPSAVPFLSGGAYVGCIMQFSRINSPVEGLQIWNASSDGFSFVISFESRNGPGLHGHPGFVASWRPIYPSRCAIKIGGSPFETFAEAEKACTAMLAHLISDSARTRPAGKRDP